MRKKKMGVRRFCAVLLSLALSGAPVLAGETDTGEKVAAAEGISAAEELPGSEGMESAGEKRVCLGIDTVHTYEHMETSYSQGYIPKIENGVVHLVVPFLASGPLRGDCLTVELDMGENAPFVYANYRKEVRKTQLSSEGSSGRLDAYVFCCDIALESGGKGGKFPVTVKAVGYSLEGYRAELSSRIFITVPDGADPEQPPGQTDPAEPDTEQPPGQTDPAEPGTEQPPGQTDSTGSGAENPPVIVPDDPQTAGGGHGEQPDNGGADNEQPAVEPPGMEDPPATEPMTEEPGTEETLPDDFGGGGGSSGGGYAGGGDTGGSAERIHRQPKFLLISDSLDGMQLMAGQEYEFTTVFQNMTGNETVCNMKVTLSSESESIDFNCSSFYFGKVRTQETVSLPTCLSIKPNAQAGNAQVTFTFDYENDQGSAYTAMEDVELEICQSSQVVLEGFRLAPQLYSTDTIDSGFAVHNAGKAAVYNVRVDFAGQGLFTTGSAFAGNLEAGASYEGELRIYVGNRTMESLGDAGSFGDNSEHEGLSGAVAEGGDAADERYGQTTGTLTLTYEDAYGEVYTQTQEYTTEILEPQVVQLSVEKPEEQTNQWQAAILVLTGVIFVLILAFVGWRLRRSKNALADLLAVQRERDL